MHFITKVKIIMSGITEDGKAYYLKFRKMTVEDVEAGQDFWCDTIGGPMHGTILGVDEPEDQLVFTIEGRDGAFAMKMDEAIGYLKIMV